MPAGLPWVAFQASHATHGAVNSRDLARPIATPTRWSVPSIIPDVSCSRERRRSRERDRSLFESQDVFGHRDNLAGWVIALSSVTKVLVTRDERQWLRPPSARTIGTSGVIPDEEVRDEKRNRRGIRRLAIRQGCSPMGSAASENHGRGVASCAWTRRPVRARVRGYSAANPSNGSYAWPLGGQWGRRAA